MLNQGYKLGLSMINKMFMRLRPFYKKMLLLTKLTLGKNLRIGKNVDFYIGRNGKLILGDNITIRDGVKIRIADNAQVVIQNNVFINDYCCLNSHKMILIKNDTIIGQFITIYDHDHSIIKNVNFRSSGFDTTEVVIGSNVWIGSFAIILRGSIINDNSVIGAGTLIKKDIKKNSIVINRRELVYFEN